MGFEDHEPIGIDYETGIDYVKVRKIVREELKKTLIEFYYEYIKPQPQGKKPPANQTITT